jgi:hypothetical protein
MTALIGLAASVGSGGCSSGGFPTDAPEGDAVAPGTVTLAWSLTDRNGQPIQCDQVGAKTVSLELRNRTKLSGVAESFSCNNSPSTSQPIEPGLYDILFELHGVNVTLSTAPTQNAVMVSAGQDTLLLPVTFAVDP